MKILKKIPIFILTYQRPKHLQKVVMALLDDPASKDFDIYVFVDGLKENASEKEHQNHQEILEIIHHAQAVRELKCFVAEQNQGVFGSLLWGSKTILLNHDAFIYLEEDIVPKKGFLEYMNRALNYYQDFSEVYAVNGFAFGEIQNLIEEPSYLATRFCPWGFATWKDRWEQVDFSLKPIRWKKWNPFFWVRFNKETWGWGWTFFFYVFFPFLRKKIQPWDILFCLHHYIGSRSSVWLKKSLVFNAGMDGSGLHQGVQLMQTSAEENPAEQLEINDTWFLKEMKVNLYQNAKIARALSPLFRKKSFKTGLSIFRKKR